jgi:hypothetical protein
MSIGKSSQFIIARNLGQNFLAGNEPRHVQFHVQRTAGWVENRRGMARPGSGRHMRRREFVRLLGRADEVIE